jgi:NAD(P)-dependent dehydrogenase (short-subunit alcohol dehydrogenase family)
MGAIKELRVNLRRAGMTMEMVVNSPEGFSRHGRLDGAVALVTGSGRGLGRMIAETLIGMGANVALHDISENAPAQYGEADSLTAVAEQLSVGGVRIIGVTGDITKEDAVAAMVKRVQQELGPISVLVNCAGGDIGALGQKPNPNGALDVSLADAAAVFQRNFMGTLLMCRAVCPGMVAMNKGAVINIGSLNAHQGVSPEVIYGCAKAAIVHYTRCLALEMRPHGVRVNAVSPGPTKSARFLATRTLDESLMNDPVSLDRYAEPMEIANAVAFLAGDNSSFISGQILRVDGAATLFAA